MGLPGAPAQSWRRARRAWRRTSVTEGHAPANACRCLAQPGQGGTPLVVAQRLGVVECPGGAGAAGRRRRVTPSNSGTAHPDIVAVQLRGVRRRPGRTDRAPGAGRADLLGYSLGAGAFLRAAIQHPRLVRRWSSSPPRAAVKAGTPRCRGMAQVGSAMFDQLRHSPCSCLAAVAPDVDAYPRHGPHRCPLRSLRLERGGGRDDRPTLLVYGDADSVPTSPRPSSSPARRWAARRRWDGAGGHAAGWRSSRAARTTTLRGAAARRRRRRLPRRARPH